MIQQIPLPGIHPRELKAGSQTYLHSYVPCNIIHNSQEVEATQMSITKERIKKTSIKWNIIQP